ILLQFFAVLLFSAIGGLIPATLFFLAVTFSPGSQTIASTVGWIQQCSSLGQFLGPPAVAWVVNLLGGWQWSWVGTMVFALLGLVMVWQLKLSNVVHRAQ
ncbi:MAG: MFS transporter, partial [Alcaligenaceae bacterium]|nr:MFS transporter [Alcaligenaceae bacterium]